MATKELLIKILGDSSKLDSELSKASKNFDNFFKKIDKVGTAMLGIGGAITGAAATVVTKTADIGDQFDKMSKRTGVAVEELSALSYAAEISGTGIETVENGLRMLATNISDAADGVGLAKDAFEALNIATTDTEGKLRPTVDVLKEAATKIADLEDETMQVALAGEIFGKRYGSELLPMLKEGGEGIEGLMERAEELGIVISTEAAESAAEYTDSMTELTGTLAAASRTIGNTLIPAITPLIEKTTEIISKISEWIAANPELVETIAKIGVVLMAGGAVIKGLVLVKGAIAAIGTLTTGPIGLLILAVTGIIAIWKNWDEIVAFVLQWKDNIVGYLVELKETATKKVQEMIDWIVKKFEDLANLPKKMKEWGTNAINGFTDGIKNATSKVTNAVTDVANGIKDFLGFQSPPKKGPLSDSDKYMPNMMNMMATGITRNIPKVSKAAEDMAKKISVNFDNMAEGAVTTTNNMMDDMGKAMEDKAITVIEPTKNFANSFMDIFTQLKNDFKSNFVQPVMGYLEDQLANAIYSLLDNSQEFEWSWKSFWEGLKQILIQAVAQMIAKLVVLAAFKWLFPFLGFSDGGGVGYAKGGEAEYYANGGPRGTDTVPAWLTPGEYVIAKPMVDFIKRVRAIPGQLTDAIAMGAPTPMPAFAGGGSVGNVAMSGGSSGGTNIYVDIHDNRISDDLDIKKLAQTVSNEIAKKIGKDRRY
jgi:TP901 family phage tail tape measure protein